MSEVEAKVVLLGKNHAGKTCLWHRYFRNKFDEDCQCTLGAAFKSRQEEIDGDKVKLRIWDTVGDEKYEALCNHYYRGATAAVICYDLTNDISYDKARFWVAELRRHRENCEIFLCGTKLDLIKEGKKKRQVDCKSVKHYANEINAKVFETSSKSGENVWELFYDVAKTCLEKRTANPLIGDQGLLSLRMEEPQNRKRCQCQ